MPKAVQVLPRPPVDSSPLFVLVVRGCWKLSKSHYSLMAHCKGKEGSYQYNTNGAGMYSPRPEVWEASSLPYVHCLHSMHLHHRPAENIFTASLSQQWSLPFLLPDFPMHFKQTNLVNNTQHRHGNLEKERVGSVWWWKFQYTKNTLNSP